MEKGGSTRRLHRQKKNLLNPNLCHRTTLTQSQISQNSQKNILTLQSPENLNKSDITKKPHKNSQGLEK